MSKNVIIPRLFLLSMMGIIGIMGFIAMPSPALASPAAIVSGVKWPDQNGNNLQCHGGDVIKVGSTYYCVGEDKSNEKSTDTHFQHVACYSSPDLAHWTWINSALSEQSSGDLGPGRIVERPKLIFNSTTNQYVMYMHID